MAVTVRMKNGEVAEVEGTPEETAEFVRKLGESHANGRAPTKKRRRAGVGGGETHSTPPVPEDRGRSRFPPSKEPPSPVEIAAFIASQPEGKHTVGSVIAKFSPGEVRTRDPDGKTNLTYNRWVFAIKAARQIVEERAKGTFVAKWEGRDRIYRLGKEG